MKLYSPAFNLSIGDEITYGGTRAWVLGFIHVDEVDGTGTGYMVMRAHDGTTMTLNTADREGMGMLDGPFAPSNVPMPLPYQRAL